MSIAIVFMKLRAGMYENTKRLEVDCRIYFYKRQFLSAICISILKLLVRVIKQAEEFDLISKDEFQKAFHELSAVRSSDITDVHSALRVL